MTIQQLIDQLQALPRDAEVFVWDEDGWLAEASVSLGITSGFCSYAYSVTGVEGTKEGILICTKEEAR